MYMGDSIVRKTEARLNKDEDIVVCLPGARIEHVTQRVEKIVRLENEGSILVHIGTTNADKTGTKTTEEDGTSKGWTDHIIRNIMPTCV